MKKHFNKELVMAKEDDEDFETNPEYWICDNAYIDGDAKLRDCCHITEKYRGSTHRVYNINVKLNDKTLSYFTT